MPERHQLVTGPVITEKSSAGFQSRKEYAFRVHLRASKPEIRTAIEALFNVTVTAVRTMVVRAKRKGDARGHVGRRPGWKKAIVTLKEGDTIQVFEG
ncbi:MAG TPA: 50S ribosomal protein L23 [Gemmatimonadales bacterium]|nr:50S ribosomal protein L23 [Gemmatimonadales bacterium]